MFQKVVLSSVVLLLVSVKLSVNGLVSDGDVPGKSEEFVTRLSTINVTVAPVLSVRGQDIGDAVKKTNAEEPHDDAKKDSKINPFEDKPLAGQNNSTVSYSNVSLDDEKKPDDEAHPLQSTTKDGTVNTSTTTKATTKVQDDPGNTETPAHATESEAATSSLEPITETTKNLTDPTTASSSSTASTASTATSSESVSESSTSSKSSTTASTTETTVTAEMVTVTLPEESSTAGKATREPKVEPTTESEHSGMSSGIIALVMAIVFAVVVIIVYVGLLLWRRYLEFRYGNRELLVNDLEFDTNDLRHFEL